MGRWIEVAERVFVRRYAELDLSVGLVVGGGQCLVIDTGGDAGQGAELASAVRDVTSLPWRVVLTHSHFDHSFGTEVFAPCQVWAHERCHADLVANGARQREKWSRRYGEQGEQEVADRIAAVCLVLPDRLVGDRAELDLGGRRVELVHFGPAHSDHDLVVHVPDAGVAYAGDLVEQGAPPQFGDAHPQSWPAALDGILALGAPDHRTRSRRPGRPGLRPRTTARAGPGRPTVPGGGRRNAHHGASRRTLALSRAVHPYRPPALTPQP